MGWRRFVFSAGWAGGHEHRANSPGQRLKDLLTMSLQAVWTIEISLLLTEGPQRRQSLGAFVCAASGPGARDVAGAKAPSHRI